ncbi:hypothetical protein EDD15DRAFT_2204819 [Pisolithus albus]|nr:hypothetical protein EDD15DRAFT_2204819 [Pisolithus albus]
MSDPVARGNRTGLSLITTYGLAIRDSGLSYTYIAGVEPQPGINGTIVRMVGCRDGTRPIAPLQGATANLGKKAADFLRARFTHESYPPSGRTRIMSIAFELPSSARLLPTANANNGEVDANYHLRTCLEFRLVCVFGGRRKDGPGHLNGLLTGWETLTQSGKHSLPTSAESNQTQDRARPRRRSPLFRVCRVFFSSDALDPDWR